jgi:DNA-binding HxlR family transcriptional regulator
MILKVSLSECCGYLRDNGGVPLTARPDLPDGTERAIDIFGNRVRVAVIRSLLVDGPATRGELSERLGVSMSLLQKHLAALEQLDAVTLTPPRSEPGVRPRTYGVDASTVRVALAALQRGLSL